MSIPILSPINISAPIQVLSPTPAGLQVNDVIYSTVHNEWLRWNGTWWTWAGQRVANRWAAIVPAPNNVNPNLIGISAIAAGGATGRSPAVTNRFTDAFRTGYVSAATAAAVCGFASNLSMFNRGPSAGIGGFYYRTRFGCSDPATVAGARQFVGFRTGASVPPNTETDLLLQILGIGHRSTDTTLQMFSNAAGVATAINLGVNFPANTLSTDWYEMEMLSMPGDAAVRYAVTRLNTGHTAVGTMTLTLPAAGNNFNLLAWRTNNATALAVGIDIGETYVEKP
jgi:hypothetical protein